MLDVGSGHERKALERIVNEYLSSVSTTITLGDIINFNYININEATSKQ